MQIGHQNKVKKKNTLLQDDPVASLLTLMLGVGYTSFPPYKITAQLSNISLYNKSWFYRSNKSSLSRQSAQRHFLDYRLMFVVGFYRNRIPNPVIRPLLGESGYPAGFILNPLG